MYPYCRVPRCVTYLYVYLVLNCIALWHFALVEADVVVISQKNNFTTDIFADLPASFGRTLPPEGLKGYVVGSSPPNACAPIEPPPRSNNYTGKWFVLIRRYDCNFAEKVRNAQNARYDAAIIHNVGSNVIEPMAAEDADDINISAVFIGQDDGLTILSHYQYDHGYMLLLTDELPFNINNYLLPFAIVVAVCFLIMLIFMVVKCVKDRRRMRRYRLPSSLLKSIPTSKYKKGDPYDTCAICLEDYLEGEKLRILPCSHAYHCKCIDPWLTRNRRVCPVCKRRVLARGEQFSDSESDSDDETRPLLRPGSYGTQGGTFQNQREIPIASQDTVNIANSVAEEVADSNDVEASAVISIESSSSEEGEEEQPGTHQAWITSSCTPESGTPTNNSALFFTPGSSRQDDSTVHV